MPFDSEEDHYDYLAHDLVCQWVMDCSPKARTDTLLILEQRIAQSLRAAGNHEEIQKADLKVNMEFSDGLKARLAGLGCDNPDKSCNKYTGQVCYGCIEMLQAAQDYATEFANEKLDEMAKTLESEAAIESGDLSYVVSTIRKLKA